MEDLIRENETHEDGDFQKQDNQNPGVPASELCFVVVIYRSKIRQVEVLRLPAGGIVCGNCFHEWNYKHRTGLTLRRSSDWQ